MFETTNRKLQFNVYTKVCTYGG